MRRRRATLAVLCPLVAASLAATLSVSGGATAGAASAAAGSVATDGGKVPSPPKTPTSIGKKGAVSSVDPYASAVGLKVLKKGGNAVDAAVATAAALGYTEPFSAGLGGGGYFVYYDAETGKVHTIDGRETAPSAMPHDAFIDPKTGEPYEFTPDLVTSGVSVGVPGTPATWVKALNSWGTRSLGQTLRPTVRLAEFGIYVDKTFHDSIVQNEDRFRAFKSSRKLFFDDDGQPLAEGANFQNRDLADTYRAFAHGGLPYFYRGALARELVQTVRKPPKSKNTDLPVPPGFMRNRDLAGYRVQQPPPTKTQYRGLDVYGMRGSSSGGTTVGEGLNILEAGGPLSGDTADDTTAALHRYLEASALSFADRAKYVGDEIFVDVPVDGLLSQDFADERACEIDPEQAFTPPVEAGDVDTADGTCDPGTPGAGDEASDTENVETTHLVTADRWGNVVSYTLTIEQTGGSGIVLPGYGFLLNNELTDFTAVYDPEDPNRIEGGKRPRSSMSPTLVMQDGKPFLALGSPGGSTIITTVLQVLMNRLDLGMTLPEAVAAPRASQRNTAKVSAEPAFITDYGAALTALGHQLQPAGDGLTTDDYIGALEAIEFGPHGLMTAAAEPTRRGGGAAYVVQPQDDDGTG